MSPPRVGKTLLELLVVMAVIAVLAGLLLVAVQTVRTRAARLQDENNLRQVGLACQTFDSQHGRLPAIFTLEFPYQAPDGNTFWRSVSPAVYLMPLLGGPPAAAALYEGQPPPIDQLVVPAYVSARDPTHSAGRLDPDRGPPHAGVGNYALNVRVLGRYNNQTDLIEWRDAFFSRPGGLGGIPDGTSNTLLLATRRGLCSVPLARIWAGSAFATTDVRVWPQFPDLPGASPVTRGAYFGTRLPAADGTGPTFQSAVSVATCDPEQAHGFEAGRIDVGLADGSVRAVRAGIAPKLWRAGLLPDDAAGLPAD